MKQSGQQNKTISDPYIKMWLFSRADKKTFYKVMV